MKGTNELKEHTESWYILTLTEVFVNQKRMTVCEHKVKIDNGAHGTEKLLLNIQVSEDFA